jgi:hypothetical protein
MDSTPINIITIISTLTALFAVFIGPAVTFAIAKRQLRGNYRIARKSVISPIRQHWIDSLRDLVSSISGRCHYYYVAGSENTTKAESIELTKDIHKLKLMVNPNEEDHKKLLELIAKLQSYATSVSHASEFDYADLDKKINQLTQAILKREWERVKHDEF